MLPDFYRKLTGRKIQIFKLLPTYAILLFFHAFLTFSIAEVHPFRIFMKNIYSRGH
jgi:hypothetical protein